MPRYLLKRRKNTLCIYNIDLGSNQRWSTPSTMTSWHHFHLTVTQNCQNLTQLQLCNNSVRVHLYAYIPHWKMLKQFIDVHYGSENQSQRTTASTITSWHHFNSTVTQYCQNLTQIQQCNSVRVHLYAWVPHWKVLKYFLDVHCGYEKQSKVIISLNHDIMASFQLNSNQNCQNLS